MRIRDILNQEAIQIQLDSSDKHEVIEKLVDIVSRANTLSNVDKLLDAVIERESLMSTGVGKGVAIPHGKSEYINQLVAGFAVLHKGVDFGAPDGIPVKIVILMIASAQDTGPHIRALAHISRILQAESLREKLLLARSAKEIMDLLEEREEEIGS
ncbi:MAG: PTS sugar transporter subunit IIA [Chlamydiota bacterium]|nr:PTS sugar transporter subunit IIA [Chlamydiota bacterium]